LFVSWYWAKIRNRERHREGTEIREKFFDKSAKPSVLLRLFSLISVFFFGSTNYLTNSLTPQDKAYDSTKTVTMPCLFRRVGV
jgi:hypothetical protein